MRGSRIHSYAAAAITVFASTGSVQAQQAPQAPGSVQSSADGRLEVEVHGLRSSNGSVRCTLYGGPRDFPRGSTDILRRVRAVPQGRSARCLFEGLAPNRDFAVVIHHDENDDGQFAQGWFGIPLEGYGFSNNVRPRLSAPSFADCRVRLGTDPLHLQIGVLY